jgi:DNA polymerase-3 subunit epsilon
VVRTEREGALGPFRTRGGASEAAELLAGASGLRTCTPRISARAPRGSPCALHEMGRCAAPCAGLQSVDVYGAGPRAVAAVVAGSDDAVLHTVRGRVEELAGAGRFESAATARDQVVALVQVLRRRQRLGALAAVDELVAARRDGAGGWHLVVVRAGRLAAAGHAGRGVAPVPLVELLVASAETVVPGPGPLRGAPEEEVALVARWLEAPGTRLVRTSGPWAEPASGAGSWGAWALRAGAAAQEAAHPLGRGWP